MSDNLSFFHSFDMTQVEAPSSSKKPFSELEDLALQVKQERLKNFTYKILLDLAFQCVQKDEKLPKDVRKNISHVLNAAEVTPCLHLEDQQFLLGITDLHRELNYEEISLLKQCVEKKILDKYCNIQTELTALTGVNPFTQLPSNVSTSNLSLSLDEKILLDYKRKLNVLQVDYWENLLKHSNLLEELYKMRTEQVPELCQAKIEECTLFSRLQELKARILHETTRVDIFTETNESLLAYKIFVEDLKCMELDCKQEIDELEELKEKYKQVECKQFSDILEKYLQYKQALEKRKLLYDRIKSK